MEGRIPGGWITRDPLTSQIVEALEAINLGVRNPYVILNAPKIENHGENYIQAWSLNSGYRCELRISGSARDSYQQWCLILPDEIGLAGTPEKCKCRLKSAAAYAGWHGGLKVQHLWVKPEDVDSDG